MKILFYPHPGIRMKGHTRSKTIRLLEIAGCELTNDIDSDWDYGVWWNYDDINTPLKRLVEDKRHVYNLYCNNITKSYTDKVFEEVFGYPLSADTNRMGMCIRKSIQQSTHDGVFIETPCKKEAGYVYQKPLDNRFKIDWIRDIRVPVYMGEIPLIFLKDRTIDASFNTGLGKKEYRIVSVEDCLYPYEVANIIEFSKRVGLEIGELDVIRDNSTGLIYVIDVNDLPGGAIFNHIQDKEKWEKLLSEFMFERL